MLAVASSAIVGLAVAGWICLHPSGKALYQRCQLRLRKALGQWVQPRVLVDDLMFGEGPRWRDGRLYFSDMHAGEVIAVGSDGSRRETIVTMPIQLFVRLRDEDEPALGSRGVAVNVVPPAA